jgi:menaquinone-dependent protoporphyrinogen oxidase
MRILIVFATTEGHTRRLAEFAAEYLRRLGHHVSVCDAARSDGLDLASFEAAFLLASLHLRRYQASLIKFAREKHAALNVMASAFVSVSLSAVGDPSNLGLRDCLKHFENDTLWRPAMVHHAAGAMPFSAYSFFMKLAIKFIAHWHGMSVKTSQDYDLTDYAALGAFIDHFLASASRSRV